MVRLKPCLAVLLLSVATVAAAAADLRPLALPANDLAYDPVSHRIYASVPSSAGPPQGNSITTIDPATGETGPALFIGSEPDKLALSDDGQYLYVGLDGAAAVRRFELRTQTAGPQFSLGRGQLPGPAHAGDMQVMPGHPQTVAVVLNDVGYSPSAEGVAIYDSGVQRPKTTSWADFVGIIAFGRSADRLYGYESGPSRTEFIRMAVDASGVTVLDTSPAGELGAEMKFADGLIYGSSGRVIDPETRQAVGSFSGVGARSQVAPDPAAGRVYFLTQKDTGSTWTLLTFDARTFLPLGTMALPGVMGHASRLIRWGQERGAGQGGLAFRTDQGQVFLIQLAPPAPASPDLALAASAMPNPVLQGANLTVTLTVTNTSPTPATGVVLTENLPSPLADTIVSISASQGQCRQSGSQIRCDLGSLAGGAPATATLVLQPGAGSSAPITAWSAMAAVTANEPDPNPSNNQVTIPVTVLPRGSGAPPAGMAIRQLMLPANDLAYDPTTHRLYASTPSSAGASGNSIIGVDAVTGAMGAPVFIGSEPDKLALSDDGRSLYVGLDGAAAVRRFDTEGQMAGPQFALGADSFFGPYYVEDMAVQPANPEVVAVSRKNLGVSPRHAGVAIYDHGVARPTITPRHTGSNVIAFSSTPDRLYGYNNETTEFGFRRMTVDAAGVTVDDVTDNLISGFGVDLRYDGGLIFSTSGREIDPEARKLLGTFSGLGPLTLVAPDVKAGRVYFLVGDNSATRASTWKLLTFDPRSFVRFGSQDIPGVMGAAHSLIRWGQERADGGGLAFATDQGQVFLIALNPPAPPAAPPALLSLSLAPDSIEGAGAVTATITLTSPAPAGGFPVMLSSSRPAAAGLPPTLTVPAGALIASTPVTVSAVSAPADVVITASAGGVTRSATLHVDPPPAPAQLVLFPNPVPGGLLALGQVTLPQPAGGSALSISLSSSNHAAALVVGPAFVPAGAITVTFPILTFPVTTATAVTITVTGPNGPVSAALQVLPLVIPAPTPTPPPAPAAGPPAAPEALSAQVLSPTHIQLFWRDTNDNETAFDIWRRTNSTDWAPAAVVPPNTTTFTDTGLTPGAAYSYRVRAINNSGASDWSNDVTVLTPGGV